MTKAELLAILKECAESRDLEGAHGRADDALLAFIGDDEITIAFTAWEKWYA